MGKVFRVGCLFLFLAIVVLACIGILATSSRSESALAGAALASVFTILLWLYARRRIRNEFDDLHRRMAALHEELRKLKEKGVPAAAAPTATPEPPPAVVMAPEPVVATAPPPPSEPPPIEPVLPEPVIELPPPPPPPPPGPSLGARLRKLLDIEEVLGTNWLNKLGVIILVIGVALYLAYELRTVGPMGRILVGLVVSGTMLGAGVYFERRERWKILARAAISGGWALLFFTTYAMYHVPAARVIESQAVDLVLLLAVGAAMVVHSLRYYSQVTTGMAFLLAFSTVTISQVNVYSLVAGAILAVALVVVVLRFGWWELEVFGVMAAYLNHWWWLRHIIEPMHGHLVPFPEYTASTVLLYGYWAVFRWSYIARRLGHEDENAERISTVAALLNSFMLLAVQKYSSVHPELAFQALLGLGIAELILGQLPMTKRRRLAFLILTTIGATLTVAAIPFRYSGMRLVALWLLEAQALLLAGVFTREVLFRYLGMLASAITALHMIAFEAAEIMGRRWDGADVAPDYRIGLLFVIATVLFYFNAYKLPALRPAVFDGKFEDVFLRRLSYIGSVMLWAGAWVLCPESWTAVVWAQLGVLLALLAHRWTLPDLRVQGNCIAAAAFLRVVFINLQVPEHRWISVGLVIILLYVLVRWSGLEEMMGVDFPASQAYAWAATAVAMQLAWTELIPAAVVLGWTLLGLVLLEWGFVSRTFSLRLQACLVLVACFFRLFFVNLNAVVEAGQFSARVYTIVPVAMAFWYAWWRFADATGEGFERDERFHFQRIAGFLGTMTLVALVRFELAPDWVAAAWAVMAAVLVWICRLSDRRYFLNQGLLLAFLVSFRALFYNFYERSYFPAPFWQSRLVTVGLALLVLCGTLYLAYPLVVREVPETSRGRFRRMFGAFGRHPEQVLFFLPLVLLTALVRLEVPKGMVTLAWGVEAVAVFVFALWMRQRSYRLAGLGLLLIAVGKIVVFDVWGLSARDRYLTFIALGAALLAVSWLYTRYRDTVKQLL